jgi:hypothetical protein
MKCRHAKVALLSLERDHSIEFHKILQIYLEKYLKIIYISDPGSIRDILRHRYERELIAGCRPCAGMDDEPSLTSAPGYTNSRGDRRSRGEVHRDTGHAGHGRAKTKASLVGSRVE